MGKDTVWVRIANRGRCPRKRLTFFGLSDTPVEVDRSNPHSIFQSGAKIAPLVALRHDLPVLVMSSDDAGSYSMRYEARTADDDATLRQFVILLRPKGGDVQEIPMPFGVDSAYKNWSNPIGDDPLAEFPIWREYLNNARGNDLNGPVLSEHAQIHWPPENTHAVFIRKTADYEAIMANPDRYFKWLAATEHLFSITTNNVVMLRIFPKSEDGATRLFAHGTLAYCSKDGADASRFDYSLDMEGLLTEERVFANMTTVYQWIGIVLASMKDEDVLLQVLRAIQDGKAPFEEHALSHTAHLEELAGEDAWCAVWETAYGDKAVISNPGFGDEYVRSSLGKKPVTVTSPTLRDFLMRCGVPEANDYAPRIIEGATYKIVDLNEKEKSRARLVFDAIRREYPDVKLPIFPFEAIGDELQSIEGFVLKSGDGTPLGIYVQKSMFSSTRWLMVVVNHEYRHARTHAADFSKPFEECADQDEGRLLLERYGIVDDTPSAVEEALADIRIDDDPTVP
ncbi:MAG: hypothetical protein QY323_03680 [Patescibacteria group bacterium]|nr:MAG: hypothetical protein QY323_03680 [Patescibacteria group bacterium]